MGSQDRNEGFICTQILQNVQLDPTGTNQIGQISKGKLGKRLYQNRRQARWSLYLSEYDVKIGTYPRKQNDSVRRTITMTGPLPRKRQ